MNIRQDAPAGLPTDAKISAAWPGFVERLASVLEALALRRAVRPTPADLHADLERRLLAVVREFTAVGELDYDDDRDIQFGYGSTFIYACLAGKPLKVRVRAILVTEVEESMAMLQRLNELNANLGSMHLLFVRGSVQAVCETPAWPFVPEQVQHALLDFCEICDGLDELLQAEFGGTIFRDQRMPSLARH